jgi:Flp pilus assembly protein TadG
MVNRRDKTLIQHLKGQSMIEFALILPLMVLVIAGIFDLGRAFFASITITNAAREGARYGTLHPDKYSDMKNASIVEAQSSGITLGVGNVAVACPDSVAPAGCDRGFAIRVTVTYTYKDMILGFIVPSGITMTRYVEMAVP